MREFRLAMYEPLAKNTASLVSRANAEKLDMVTTRNTTRLTLLPSHTFGPGLMEVCWISSVCGLRQIGSVISAINAWSTSSRWVH